MNDRSSQAAAEVIHRGTRFMIPGGRVREEIGRVELGAVPQLIQVSVELVGPGFRDIVDLRRAVSAQIHRVGNSVDGHLRDRVQSEDEIGGKSAVEIR